MKLKIEFEKEGQVVEKEFATKRMRGRALKRMLEITDVMDNAGTFTQEHYDLMCEYICEMFGNVFSVDDLLDGLDLEEIYPVFMALSEEIGKKTMKKVEDLIKK